MRLNSRELCCIISITLYCTPQVALKTVQAVSIYGGVISRLDIKTSCKMSKADAFVLIVIVASMTFRKANYSEKEEDIV